jgi:pyrroline-5-carboxylate reductase
VKRFDPILVVGFGTMAAAIVDGWLAAGLPSESVTAYNPRPKDAPAGVTLVAEFPRGSFQAILLAVKPQKLDEVALLVEPLAGSGTVLISVLAGVELETLAGHFPRAGGIVRLMPNLAAALGKSPVALAGSGIEPEARDKITAMADALGGAFWIDEKDFELVTALAGSGPAFVYRFIDALAGAAAALGLDTAQAGPLALQTVEGAAALAAVSPHSPRELARRVASPGGMTQKGLDVLDADGALAALLRDTLRAARDRGLEMGRAARGKA